MPQTAETLISLGREARSNKRLSDAKNLFSKALTLSRASGDPSKLAESLTGLGQIERDLGNNSIALQHYSEAVLIYRTLPDALKLAHTVRHEADILRHMGSIERANQCYEEALTIYREHSETPDLDLANAIRGFALLKETAGEPDHAKSLWLEAKDLYQAVDVLPGVRESDKHISELSLPAGTHHPPES